MEADCFYYIYRFGYRVKFYTQEIVFFRQDMLYRMRRSCLMPPSTEETCDHFEHVVCPSCLLIYLPGNFWFLES